MSTHYVPVLWNRQKKRYDLIMVAGMALYVLCFTGVSLSFDPAITPETLIIRMTGSLAIVMLHVILLIGPLSRLWPALLPVLYNRRHLGVSMFLMALIHGGFATFQFHALGDTQPVVSILTANLELGALSRFPFQPFGLLALLILFVMAATSHDFWLKNLSPFVWKSLHMLVYVAYAALIVHVALGILQYEASPVRYGLLLAGVIVVSGAHLAAAIHERRGRHDGIGQGMVLVCTIDAIREDRAKVVVAGDQEIAVFKYDGKLSAVHNLCKHQNGPIGEGKIVDGCITCPWHGYQYLPENGQSPPPFTEKIHTYRLEVRDEMIYVDPTPLPEGTAIEPVNINKK